MALAVPQYTVQDLERLPDDGNRYELLDGLLLVTPAPSLAHQVVVSRLMVHLQQHVGTSATVLSSGAVEIQPKVHLEPDILVIPAAAQLPRRWNDLRTWWLAVEVSGRGSRVYDRDFKFAAYTAIGVHEVWRVDLPDRCVFVSRAGQQVVRQVKRLAWQPLGRPDVRTIDVPSLFEGIQGDD